MKHLRLALLAATAIGGAAFASSASADVTWAWNAGIANDYVFRGIDQTTFTSSGEAFGGVDVTINSQFYVGTWVSNTGPDFDRGYEYDIYGGWRPSAMGVNWDIGGIFYGYTNSPGGFVSDDFNTFELRAGGTIPIGSATIGAVGFWSPDFAGSDENGFYGEVNASYTFANHATVSAAVGHQWVDDSFFANDGYTTWNVGVSYPVTEHITVMLQYVDTDDAAEVFTGLPQDQHLVATVRAGF
jgi:uncharacterized protein (TIGR02001 family)